MRDFFQSYLFSFLFWIDLPLGALALLMTYHLTGGNWGKEIRKILECLSDTLPAFAVFLVPVLIGAYQIYPWLELDFAGDPKLQAKKLYLNYPFFIIRAVFYFIFWLGINFSLQRKKAGISLGKRSAGGLVLLCLTVTFASLDWQMSVEPKWYSTIYGMVYALGQALQGFAFALVVYGTEAWRRGPQKPRIQTPKKQILWDLGNILLTLVILWTYLAFMQYLIVWSGNLPHEVTWFQNRSSGGWQWLALFIATFQFSAPFGFLLFRTSKDRPIRLACLGGLIFLVRILDHYWMLMPGLMPDHFRLPWQALVIWVAMGAIWFAIFLRKLSAHPSAEVTVHA